MLLTLPETGPSNAHSKSVAYGKVEVAALTRRQARARLVDAYTVRFIDAEITLQEFHDAGYVEK